MKKWRCSYCKEIIDENNLLIADNPFDTKDIIIGCRFCFSVNSVLIVCDEYACENLATFGYQTSDGYKNVCGQHMRKYKGNVDEVGVIHALEDKIKTLEKELSDIKGTPTEGISEAIQ